MSKRKTPAYIEDSDEELSKEVLAVPAGCVIHLQSEQCSGQTVGKPASPYWCRLANVVTITACSICISVFVPVANIMHGSEHCSHCYVLQTLLHRKVHQRRKERSLHLQQMKQRMN